MKLMSYTTGETLRDAMRSEAIASLEAAARDGGVGVIEIDGESCYVEVDDNFDGLNEWAEKQVADYIRRVGGGYTHVGSVEDETLGDRFEWAGCDGDATIREWKALCAAAQKWRNAHP